MAIDDKLVTLGDLKTVIDNTHDSTKQDTLTFDATPTQGSTNPVTSGGIYTGLDGKVDKENGKGLSTNDFTDADKQKLAELSQYVAAGIIFDTASGSVASFTDGGDGLPVKSVSVDVDPVQDLHGYDKPWTGGAGKNLLPLTVDGIKAANGGASSWNGNSKTISGVTFTINTDSSGNVISIKANGTTTNDHTHLNIPITLTPGMSYIVNGCPSGGSAEGYRIVFGGADIQGSDTGGGFTVSSWPQTASQSLWVYVRDSGITLNNLVFYPMVRLASISDATFEPYSNICPITGHTGAAITREGADSSQTQTYNITFPAAAGTVYGGTLDLNAGRLTVDKASIASYSGQSINTPWLSSMDEYAEGRTPTAGAQVVYPLTTPVTYSFTAEEITTFFGINHVWADTGDVSVEYAADPKLYINKVIANALSA